MDMGRDNENAEDECGLPRLEEAGRRRGEGGGGGGGRLSPGTCRQ